MTSFWDSSLYISCTPCPWGSDTLPFGEEHPADIFDVQINLESDVGFQHILQHVNAVKIGENLNTTLEVHLHI